MKLTSTLASIAQQVWTATDAASARSILISYLEGTNVKDRDKMIAAIRQLASLNQIQRYTANALLKFEGLGIES